MLRDVEAESYARPGNHLRVKVCCLAKLKNSFIIFYDDGYIIAEISIGHGITLLNTLYSQGES